MRLPFSIRCSLRFPKFIILAAASIASQLVAEAVTIRPRVSSLEARLDPGEMRNFRVEASGGGVTWSLSGPGQIEWDPEWSGDVMYRAPRAGAGKALLTATSDRDPDKRVVFTLELSPSAATAPPPQVDLTPLIACVPGERNQGSCSDCYAWAATAALEVELAARYGIRDRLSIQYFHSIYTPRVPGDSKDPCCSNSFSSVLEHYQRHGRMVPWSNPWAAFQDRYGRCDQPRDARRAVGLFPHYRVLAVNSVQIETRLWSGEECIEEIKSVLARRKAIIFNRSGHYMAIVGFDARDPDPGRHSWLILDSAGSSATFSLPMRSLDYQALKGPMEHELQFDYVEQLQLDLQPLGITRVQVEPAGMELALGEPLELVASAEARPPVIYQWMKEGLDLPGCTGSVLSLPSVNKGDAGAYQVRVADWGGKSATSEAVQVAVNDGATPRVRIQPSLLILGEGEQACFHATVAALGDTRVAWSLLGAGTLEEMREGSIRFTASGGPGPRTLEARAVADPSIAFQVPITVKGTDLNGDGRTDILDLALLAQAYRSLRGDPHYLEAADLNGDGTVDEADALAFLNRWDSLP